ncbi:MAG: outer membrane protein assembly factor BamA [Deltaproteobacteria bacterium]|nr:outer membrane protein assembly factor BamA [Deltaproteobacteria bacterium]
MGDNTVARRLVLILTATLALLHSAALAQEQDIVFKRVAVLPFTVLSKTPMEFVGEKIRREFQERLQAEGFSLPPPEAFRQELARLKEAVTEPQARDIGQRLGVDVVVWGRLIVIGEALSLEAHILDLKARPPAATLKAQGVGLKMVPDLTRKLAQETALKILGKERIARIDIKGNRRIERDAILGAMQTREGEMISPARLREDLKAIFKMGYFTDVKFDLSDTPQGRILTVLVEEKPAIRDIIVRGNRKIKKDKILEVMELKKFSVASEPAIRDSIDKALALYREKGYYEAKITYNLEPFTKTEVNLVLNVDEGVKLSVKEIDFEGNTAFKSRQLRGVMETKTWNVLAWFTGAGRLNKDVLERDLEKVSSFYMNHGYIKVKVGEPRVDIRAGRISIVIPITEGPQYKIGNVDFRGDLLEDKDQLRAKLEIIKAKTYSREILQQDLTTLTDLYADQGYANADITPLIKENEENLTVDIVFDIHQGKKVSIERIEISGNIKTRDKVIRRELRVYEQELFSATKLKESLRNLRRLEYFEDVNFTQEPGSAPDRMNLKISVKERPTGSFGVGVGYSTQDRLVGMVEISQTNLFGRGQHLKLQGLIGSITNRFRFSFTEPYLFDRPLAVGVDAFNWERQYDEYNRKDKGGSIRLAHPLRWQYTRLYGSYRFENVDISGLRYYASPVLKEAATIHNTSAGNLTLRRDSRDSLFLPTKGSDNSISIEMAGWGGDTAFMRYVAESGWYYNVWRKTVFVLHGRIGYMSKLPWGKLPAYEKFYLGGIDTIRGFKFAEISPRDPVTNERIGGEKFAQLNVEWRYPIPILHKFGMTGTVFFDTGNVWRKSEAYFSDMRTAVGGGVRWYSPMGPLRIEWGYNLRPKPWERRSAWEFSVGGSF